MKGIKNKLFWLIDDLKGKPLKNDLDEITQCLEFNTFSELKIHTQPKLKTLLNFAVNNTMFYKKNKGYKSLSDFPVINKISIKNNADDFTILKHKTERLFKVSTSGSTGMPHSIYQTKRKKTRNRADVIYFGNAAGYTIGDQLLYLRLWAASNKKNAGIAKLQNIKQLDIRDLYDDRNILKLIRHLKKDASTKGWLGYSSGFETICQYLDKIQSPKLNCNVKSIIAMAEYLSPTVKAKMEYYFQCPMVSRYSNVENGIIAQQLPNTDAFTINWASYIVEILNFENDKPVNAGELGRIVVTDLYNLATPMIRYDTGDVGTFASDATNTDALPKLSSVQGRKMDVLFTTHGSLLNPYVLWAQAYQFNELNQIQYIQLSKTNYTIKINSKLQFKREDYLLELFKNEVGANANVNIEYVNEIPTLRSGKRKLTVNLYTKN